MKGAAFLAIALLLLATMPVLVRCETTFVNEQFTLDNSNTERSYDVNLTRGDTIGITLHASGQGAAVDFQIAVWGTHGFNPTDKWQNIGGEECISNQQWSVVEDYGYDFEVTLVSGDQATVTITLTSAGTGSQPPSNIKASGGLGVVDLGGTPSGGGGGFDPTPIVVVVMVLLAVLISAFFIIRLRKQPPPPPPAEGQPPPPP
jgi:hypothetical protein